MKPFFVYSHLGANIDFWNNLLSSHRRIMSIYDSKSKNMYMNGDLTERIPEPKKWFFSKAKWFDILLHNKQVGYKSFYSDYPSIIIFSFQSGVLDKIKEDNLYEKKYADNYLHLRYERLLYICKNSIKPLVFVEGLSSVEHLQNKICDFLSLKNECVEVKDVFIKNNFEENEFFKRLLLLNESGKISLAI